MKENLEELISKLWMVGVHPETIGLMIYSYYKIGQIDYQEFENLVSQVDEEVSETILNKIRIYDQHFSIEKLNIDYIRALNNNQNSIEDIIDVYCRAFDVGVVDKESLLALVKYYDDPDIVSFDEDEFNNGYKGYVKFINLLSIKIMIDNEMVDFHLKKAHINELFYRLYRDNLFNDIEYDIAGKYVGLRRK